LFLVTKYRKEEDSVAEKYIPRLQKLYKEELVASLMKELNITNVMQVPKIEKIVVNMGIGEAVNNPKLIDTAMRELGQITGQQPVARAAKKSEAGFKLREGQKIGAKVTLRKEKMYEFLDRLISITLPRVRDFEGVSPKGFDGRGNYTLGIREQIVFPEIEIDKVDKTFGVGITIVSTARTDEEGRALLKAFGMPFAK
jgi:50S ribosomal protein L5